MVETFKKIKEHNAMLTYLSKDFDCLPNNLVTKKLDLYGFSMESLNLINDYLTECKQSFKINNQFSSWLDTLFCLSQGSILGQLLFNIFLFDMFLSKCGCQFFFKKNLRARYPKNIIIGHLNINLLRNKFEILPSF